MRWGPPVLGSTRSSRKPCVSVRAWSTCAPCAAVRRSLPGVDMLYDRAGDLQQALDALDTLVADARDDLDTLETALDEDDTQDRL